MMNRSRTLPTRQSNSSQLFKIMHSQEINEKLKKQRAMRQKNVNHHKTAENNFDANHNLPANDNQTTIDKEE
jgi:hypothetical protein